ncbi:large ribosomal subunit protein mL62 isoform X2 [Panulirus ornatus]
MEKMQVSYSRSSGPGGQNVNKVNTKVDLRFNLASADWLSQELKEKVAEMYKNSITVEGFLVVRSDKTRSQQLNLADAMDKLRHMIHTAAYVPPPSSKESFERSRRRHEASVRERLRQKRVRSQVKQGRQEPQCD